jgi:hypothetical protein
MMSDGILEYGPEIRAVVWIDPNIALYYRKLMPQYLDLQPQKYPAHITVVRLHKEIPNLENWNKYAGEKILFSYENKIYFDGTYYYLNAYSDRIGEIRMELGLPKFRFGNSYHITLGNSK